jgi:adenylate cyclase
VQTVLGYYAPPHVVRRLAEESVNLEADKQLVHGTCLFTDAEEYTTISEALHPDDLRKLMNEYYQVMFGAVTRHGGHISDTAGDSMVAVWTTAEPDAASRARACRAAGQILDALADFNRHRGRQQLPTRIGLESGQLLLGNVGAGQHFEYRAIGDIVNTASRLQGLNRLLGTRVLISAATLAGTGLQARDLGVFLLRGKTTPLRVYEPALGVGGGDRQLLEQFAEALACVQREAWPEARQRFARLVASYPADGPAAFYDALMTDYERRPPADWRGYVSVNAK